jgi:hypothetical protein
MARVPISGRVAISNRVAIGSPSRFSIETTQNLITRSEEFTNAAWNANSAVTVTANQIAAPDTTVSADLIAPDGTNNRHYSAQAITVPSPYQFNPRRMSYSCFLKGNGAQWAMIGDDRHTAFIFAWFDLTNGVVGTVTADNDSGIAVTNRIEALPNVYYPSAPSGWYRCTMTYTMVSPSGGAGSNASAICIGPTTANGTQSFDGTANPTKQIYAWGAQMVASANWTGRYVQTVGSAQNSGSIRSLP